MTYRKLLCLRASNNIFIIEDDIDDFLDDSNSDDETMTNDGDVFPPGGGVVDKRNMIMRLIR